MKYRVFLVFCSDGEIRFYPDNQEYKEKIKAEKRAKRIVKKADKHEEFLHCIIREFKDKKSTGKDIAKVTGYSIDPKFNKLEERLGRQKNGIIYLTKAE